MAERKTIAVVGSTGSQGGGLVRAILEDPDKRFAARAITRKPSSETAKALTAIGAEVVRGDADDAASMERAFAGAYGAFCVTNFWEHFSPEREIAQATNLARAAKAAGLEHVVWSTLEDTRRWMSLDDDRMPTLMEKYKVPHFDAKGEADETFRSLGVPATFLLTSFFWDNFIFGMEPQRGEDGTLSITMPMGEEKLPGIAADDIGRCAFGILAKGPSYAGRTVGIAGGHLTGREMAAALGDMMGEEVVYNEVPPDVFRAFDFPGAADLANMFQFKRDFNDEYCAARDVEQSRALNPSLQSFEAWLAANGERIPRR